MLLAILSVFAGSVGLNTVVYAQPVNCLSGPGIEIFAIDGAGGQSALPIQPFCNPIPNVIRLFSHGMPAQGNPWGNAGLQVNRANAVGGIDASATMVPGGVETMHQSTSNVNNSLANGLQRRTLNAHASRRLNVTLTGRFSYRPTGTSQWRTQSNMTRTW